MDRFNVDDVEDEYDAVEPMRASSFDMSFTLSSGPSNAHSAAATGASPFADGAHGDASHSRRRDGHSQARISWKSGARATHGHSRPSHTHSNSTADSSASWASSVDLSEDERLHAHAHNPHNGNGNASGHRKPHRAMSIGAKLEEKAHEAMELASLRGPLLWRLQKRAQDVRVYTAAATSTRMPHDEAHKVFFRASCEVKASLSTIMDYLAPSDSKAYFDIETQVFPGLLHASVVKRMELQPPDHHADGQSKRGFTFGNPTPNPTTTKENLSPSPSHNNTQEASEVPLTASGVSSGDGSSSSSMANLPSLVVKWHASRCAGLFVKPVDFFFVEYANVDVLPDGRERGFAYVRSVETFKGDELATRMKHEKVSIPQSVSKCKRAMINKGIYLVTPSGDEPGSYEVTIMLVLDFEDQFNSTVASRFVTKFTERLIGIRELLYNTLFQTVKMVPKREWKKSTTCAICNVLFSFVKPLHHCRACGDAVCGQCSRKWTVQAGDAKEDQTRICTSCSLQARTVAPSPTMRDRPGSNRGGSALSSGFGTPLSSSSAGNVLSASANQPPARAAPVKISLAICDVLVGSGISDLIDASAAAEAAFASLVEALNGRVPHFMMVSYSRLHDGTRIYEALAAIAPDTLFMGGTSSAGVFCEKSSAETGPVLGLWGIYDPEGSYAVLNADFNEETARDATRRCILQGMRMLCLPTEDSADFIWMNVTTGHEDSVVRAVNEVVDCSFSVVGGSSATSPASFPRATQICSESGNVGPVTTNGACFAICCPSVHVVHGLFTCYEPKDKSFVVTHASGRKLHTLNHKPAFTALNEACHGMLHEFVSNPTRFTTETTKLTMYYLLARQQCDSRTSTTSRFQVIQTEKGSKDHALHMGVDLRVGEKLRMTTVSAETIQERLTMGFREVLRASGVIVDAADVVGALVSVSTNYPLLAKEGLTGIAETTALFFRESAVLGAVSHGQQGVLVSMREVVHANAMVTSLLITNRKKSGPLTAGTVPAPLIRRYSTF